LAIRAFDKSHFETLPSHRGLKLATTSQGCPLFVCHKRKKKPRRAPLEGATLRWHEADKKVPVVGEMEETRQLYKRIFALKVKEKRLKLIIRSLGRQSDLPAYL
jgi:hypothetical protein